MRMKKLLTITAIVALCTEIGGIVFPATLPVSAAADDVSYLTNLYAHSVVPLEPLDDKLNIEIVEYDESDAFTVGLDGEVLSSQSGQSDVSNLCSGIKMINSNTVCSTISVNDSVTNSGSSNMFSQSCNVRIILGTYPMFFHGGDFDCNNRYDIDNGEWPPFSQFGGQLQPSATFASNGEIYLGPDGLSANDVNTSPNYDADYMDDGTPITTTEVTSTVTGTSNGANVTSAVPSKVDLGLPNKPCECSPLDASISCPCASGSLAKANFSKWENPASESSGTVIGSIVNGQSNLGSPFMAPDPGKALARLTGAVSECKAVDNVFPDYACLNAGSALMATNLSFQVVGFFSNLGCIVRGDCMFNVRVMVETGSLLGSNSGCEEPCGDVYSDSLVSAQRAPNSTTASCTSYGSDVTGLNAPCVEDKYVGTIGLCSVCGMTTSCTFVWKNWLYDNYLRERANLGPCVRKFKNIGPVRYNMCHFEKEAGELGYFEYVRAMAVPGAIVSRACPK